MRTYRFGMAWRALGVTLVALAILFPVLMIANHENVDGSVVLISAGFVLAGASCSAYFARYRVTIAEDGMTVECFGRRPAQLPWREVVAVRTTENAITFQTTGRQEVAISIHFPGYEAVEEAAARHLPDVAFSTPAARPVVAPEIVSDQDRREHHRARQRFWLRASGRSLLFAILMGAMAFAAAFAVEHGTFRQLPRAVAIVLLSVLAFAKSWGNTLAILLVVLSFLFAIMAIQEALHARRVPAVVSKP
jgi:hypothetical protein